MIVDESLLGIYCTSNTETYNERVVETISVNLKLIVQPDSEVHCFQLWKCATDEILIQPEQKVFDYLGISKNKSCVVKHYQLEISGR